MLATTAVTRVCCHSITHSPWVSRFVLACSTTFEATHFNVTLANYNKLTIRRRRRAFGSDATNTFFMRIAGGYVHEKTAAQIGISGAQKFSCSCYSHDQSEHDHSLRGKSIGFGLTAAKTYSHASNQSPQRFKVPFLGKNSREC